MKEQDIRVYRDLMGANETWAAETRGVLATQGIQMLNLLVQHFVVYCKGASAFIHSKDLMRFHCDVAPQLWEQFAEPFFLWKRNKSCIT